MDLIHQNLRFRNAIQVFHATFSTDLNNEC